MRSYLMRTAWDVIKSQVFKTVLARLSETNVHQRAAAPVFFEKLETYLEPWARAFPKAVNFAVLKVALAIVMLASFFALFSEALRQIDMLGGLVPGAYLIGYAALFALSVAGFFLVKPPRVERVVAAERAEMFGEGPIDRPADRAEGLQAGPAMSAFQSESPEGLRDFSNVEALRRPTPLSAAEYLLNELRAERARFAQGR